MCHEVDLHIQLLTISFHQKPRENPRCVFMCVHGHPQNTMSEADLQ